MPEWGVTAKEDKVSYWGDENVLKSTLVMVAKLCEYTKDHWIVHFQWVSFMACEFYLNESTLGKESEPGQVTWNRTNLHDEFIGLADSCSHSSQNNPGV